jgi:mono/diheme cytochrome c family protein
MNFVLMLAMATVAAAAPAKTSPGEKIYQSKCSTCHGKDAKGKPMMAKIFKTDLAKMDLTGADFAKKDDKEVEGTITKGLNKMPSFKGKLKDAEIKEVVGYVRSLGPKAEKKAEGGK